MKQMHYLQQSITNHDDYSRLCNLPCKHFYVIEIEGLEGRMDIPIQLQQVPEFSYKNVKLSTSISKDGVYTNTNGVVQKTKKQFDTSKLLLQNDVSLSGYSLEEEQTSRKAKQWGDEDGEEGLVFQKETIQYCHVFTLKNVLTVYIFENKIVLKVTETDHIEQYLDDIMHLIYPSTPFILTLEEEKYIKNNTLVQHMKSVNKLFDYSYLLAKKPEKSIIVHDYFQTIPCLRFTLYGSVYLLDQYDNLKKIREADKTEADFIDNGFVNIFTGEFTSMDGEEKLQFDVLSTDALVYNGVNGFEIYSLSGNIYIDEIVNKMFVRRTFSSAKIVTNPIFSRRAMSVKQLKSTKATLKTIATQKLVRRFCKNLDIDYLLNLTSGYKKAILKECKTFGDNYLASFFVKMLSFKYNETEPIQFELTDTPNDISSMIITNKTLALEKLLEQEKDEIDVFHNYRKDSRKYNYYTSITKVLDQLKVYSREVEKRVHKAGSITNAWMKCWEMIQTFQLVPKNHSDQFTIFCNAEFPGAFILALNHYIKTQTDSKKYEWYANSLWPGDGKNANKEIFKDSFDLYKKYPDRWLMNAQNGGSVLDPKMIQIIEDRLKDKVDLYTSDIGIGAELNEEEVEAPLNLGQIICALKTLKQGGTMVCKMFLFFKPFNMSLLRLLCNVFDHFYITKPMASRAGNSEIYIVGKGYKKDEDVIDLLMHTLVTWNEKSMQTYIEPITEDFYVKLVYALYYIYGRQLRFLKKNMDIVRVVSEMFKGKEPKHINSIDIERTSEKDEFILRKKMVEEWKMKFPIPPLQLKDDL